ELSFAFEPLERLLVGLPATFAVRDDQAPDLSDLRRERSLRGHPAIERAALEAPVRVSGERAFDEADLGEDLKSVAHAEHVTAALRVLSDRGTNGRRAC